MAKAKLPKKVGGVKLPKKLRRQAKEALKLTGTGAVRDLAIAGLTLAAERALDSMQAGRTGKKIKSSLDRLDLTEVLRAAAAEGARRFLESFEAPKARPAAAAKSRPAPAARPKKAAPPARRKPTAKSRGAPAG